MLKQLNPTKDTLKTREMNTKRELRLFRNKQKYDNICNGKHKQMRSSWQNDMLEQWVMHWAFKQDVLGSILGLKIEKFFCD